MLTAVDVYSVHCIADEKVSVIREIFVLALQALPLSHMAL